MGKGSSSAPPPPDPAATAAAQATANKEAAIAQAQINMVDQITPWGSLTYSQLPGSGKQFDQAGYDAALAGYQTQLADYNKKIASTANLTGEEASGNPYYGMEAPKAPTRDSFFYGGDETPRYKATQTLSPEQQALLGLQNQAAQTYGETANRQLDAVSSKLGSPLDFSTLGPLPAANEQTRQATYEAMLQREDPRFARDREALETRLANQGIMLGSDAYNTAIDELNRSRNDFGLGAQTAALGQMGQLYGLESNAYDRAANQMIQERAVPLNELAAMLSGSQVQNPQFINPPQQSIQPADVMGATYGSYNAQMNQYAMDQQRRAAQTQGLFGLLGSGAQAAALAWSDARLKRDIRRVGTVRGMGLYRFRYLWDDAWQIGLMAQDVLRTRPYAVRECRGFLAVDYAAALGD